MAGKRSDPKKLAADRDAIRQSLGAFARRGRVQRSQAKAKAAAEAFKTTREGTLGEAWNHMLDEAAERRHVKKYGGPPEVRGAAVTGSRKNNSPV